MKNTIELAEATVQNYKLPEFVQITGLAGAGLEGEVVAFAGQLPDSSVLPMPCRLNAHLIGVCTEGEADMMLNLERVTLKKNTLYVLAPNHILQHFATRDFSASLLLVSSDLFNHINIDTKRLMPLSIGLKDTAIELSDEEARTMVDYINRVSTEIAAPQGAFAQDLIATQIVGAMYKVGDILMQYANRIGEMGTVKHRAEDYFKQFMALLNKHFLTERSVGFYADQLNITPKYLTTLIKRVSGRSVSQWVDYYVTIEAKTMLKFTDMSILEISNALNFANQSFFGSYFRRNAGMSPSQYRAMR